MEYLYHQNIGAKKLKALLGVLRERKQNLLYDVYLLIVIFSQGLFIKVVAITISIIKIIIIDCIYCWRRGPACSFCCPASLHPK